MRLTPSVHPSIGDIEAPSATAAADVFGRGVEWTAGRSLSFNGERWCQPRPQWAERHRPAVCVSEATHQHGLLLLQAERRTHGRCTNTGSCVTSLALCSYDSGWRLHGEGLREQSWTKEYLDSCVWVVPSVRRSQNPSPHPHPESRKQAQHVPNAGLAVSQHFYWTL